MNLYFRLIIIIISSLFSKRVRCDDKTVTRWRVLPNDIDVYGHMNNGRYLTLLSLAAMGAVIRTGLMKSSMKRGYLFIFDQSQVQWIRPLKLFEKYTIEVQMVHCEGRYLYATGSFMKTNGKIAAKIHYRCCLKTRTGKDFDLGKILACDGLELPVCSGEPPLPRDLFVAINQPDNIAMDNQSAAYRQQ